MSSFTRSFTHFKIIEKSRKFTSSTDEPQHRSRRRRRRSSLRVENYRRRQSIISDPDEATIKRERCLHVEEPRNLALHLRARTINLISLCKSTALAFDAKNELNHVSIG